jgi:2-oxoglutarate ferredoxin oxidoreductase subunit beta
MMTQHDGSRMQMLHSGYDVPDRVPALTYMQQRNAEGEIVIGLLHVDPNPRDLRGHLTTSNIPLSVLGDEALIPGKSVLVKINAALREVPPLPPGKTRCRRPAKWIALIFRLPEAPFLPAASG